MGMNEFEKEYYEADQFWSGNMVQDDANKKRIELTAAFVKDDVKSLLDVGCGNGVFLNYINNLNRQVRLVGLERSETALSYVKTEKIQANIEQIPIPDQSFDCVTCLEVIEHLPVNIYEKALNELARVSNKYIIISVPYKEVLEEGFTQCPGCKSIFNLDLHLRSYDELKLRELLLSREFKCIDTITTGTSTHLRGQRTFRKIFYPELGLTWRSPICPICGFSEKYTIENKLFVKDHSVTKKRRKLISYFTFLPKLFWPTKKKDYWIIALYQRNN